MAKGDRQVQKVIDTLGVEVVRELTGKPEATESEIRQLVRQASPHGNGIVESSLK
jgi:hypothetical protein